MINSRTKPIPMTIWSANRMGSPVMNLLSAVRIATIRWTYYAERQHSWQDTTFLKRPRFYARIVV